MGRTEGDGSTPVYRRRGTRRSPLRLSPTSIAIFQRCPKEYKFRYIDKLGEQYLWPRPYFTMGNHVHAALKDLLSAPEEQRTLARAEQLLLEHWGRSRLGFRDDRDEQRWQERALAQVTAFAQSPYVRGSPLVLEASLEARVSPEVMLYGRVDRADLEADGSLRIMDYKTGKVPPLVDWKPMELHALLLSMADSPQVSHLCFLYLDTCTPVSREISSLDLERARWELLGVALKIRQESRHLPRPGAWCRNCDFASICPARTQGETRAGLLGQLEFWDEWPDDT